MPPGAASDSLGNVWVTNSGVIRIPCSTGETRGARARRRAERIGGERLSHLCGARLSTCPKGEVGAAISPDAGYAFDGLQRNTGVQVDSAGNVWLTNNWIKFPVQIDPFGDGLVVYLGMAAPVRTPLVGTPRRP